MKLKRKDGKLMRRDGKLIVVPPTPPPDYFEMIVKTDNPGDSNNNQFTIPTGFMGTFNYEVETSEQNLSGVTGDVTLEWATAGTYYVRITGQFPNIRFNNGGDKDKLLEVSNWGNNGWLGLDRAFMGCSNFNITADDVPDLSDVTNFNNIFLNAASLTADIGNWDVSNVTNMIAMFRGATSFNQDIGNWDVSNVTTMNVMFDGATSFNQDLSGWCVEQITSEPANFANNTPAWTLPKPNWGDPC